MIYILILFSFFAVLFVLNILYKNTNYFINQKKQVEKFENVPSNLEIINLGSSYAKFAFDYSNTTLKGFNFALQPQSLSYDFRILKQYTPNLKKGCVVQIILPNLVFGFLDYNYDGNNTKYYYFLNPQNIIGYNKFKYLTKIAFPILGAKRAMLNIIRDVPKNDSYDQLMNLLTKEQVEREAFLRVEGWKKQFGIDSTVTCNHPKELRSMFVATTALLNTMIEYCLDKNFKPVIVIPPTSKTLNEMLSKEFMESVLYKNIKISNKYDIPVLDYLYDERFQDYKFYLNSDFLNKQGREYFSKTVFIDLKKTLFKGEKLC